MASKSSAPKKDPEDRRRFLRRSIRGTLPLLAGLGDDPPDATGPDRPETPAASPPPENAGEAPAAAKEKMDQHRQEFHIDNPTMTRYPSD
jgi:hypothetical protein